MAVSGTVNVSASFVDTYTATGVDSEKKAALSHAETFSGGKVAVISGTVGTTAITLDTTSTGYIDAEGNEVQLSQINKVAFKSNPGSFLIFNDTYVKILSTGDRVAMTCCLTGYDAFDIQSQTGTSTYTVLLYGS